MEDKLNTEVKPFIISRTFYATIDFLWQMWTTPEHLKHWWGPKDSAVKYSKIDLRPGGSYHYCLMGPDGKEIWGKQVYREIEKSKQLVFVNSFSDERGSITRHPLAPEWPLEMLTIVSFVDNDGKTIVTVEWIPMNADKEEVKTFDLSRRSMNEGWSGSFDKLEAYINDLTAENEAQFFDQSL